jgi:hypothetical protein
MPCIRLLRYVKRIANAESEDRKEGCVAQVVVITRDELRQVLLKRRVLFYGLTPDGRRLCGIARAAGEGHPQSRLADVVEPRFQRGTFPRPITSLYTSSQPLRSTKLS